MRCNAGTACVLLVIHKDSVVVLQAGSSCTAMQVYFHLTRCAQAGSSCTAMQVYFHLGMDNSTRALAANPSCCVRVLGKSPCPSPSRSVCGEPDQVQPFWL
jgi:hypothetical protein